MKAATGLLIVGIVLGLAAGVEAAPTIFLMHMSGLQEAPGPGDPDGTGTAFLAIDPDALTVDWSIAVSNIDFPLTGAHIHQAPAGVPGPIVVDFNSQLSGTTSVDPAILAGILATPTNYYVNVHNADFPAGAIRGQLGAPIPAPSALGLVVLGVVSLLSRRKPV
jgi:hypothetical protein